MNKYFKFKKSNMARLADWSHISQAAFVYSVEVKLFAFEPFLLKDSLLNLVLKTVIVS